MPAKGKKVDHASFCLGGKCRGGCWKQSRQATVEIDSKKGVDYYARRAKMRHIYVLVRGAAKPIVGQYAPCGFKYRGAPSDPNAEKCPDCGPYFGASIMEYPIQALAYPSKQNQDLVFLQTGEERMGKSAYQFLLGDKMARESQAAIDKSTFWSPDYPTFEAYEKAKADRIAQVTADQDRGNYWELFGRLLGMALQSGDEGFYRILEGIHAGYLNKQHGRPALGKKAVLE